MIFKYINTVFFYIYSKNNCIFIHLYCFLKFLILYCLYGGENMDITLKELLLKDNFKDIKLIAGKNGLNRVITDCAVLDYQFDPELNISHPENFFMPGQLIFTSFLYAKDNEFLILDALKKLTERNVCGLVINNIYKIPINDMIIKIANSKNFPIFLLKNSTLRLENIILHINNNIHQFKSTPYFEKIIDEILNSVNTDTEKVQKLYPAVKELYTCIYFSFDSHINTLDFNIKLNSELSQANLGEAEYVNYKYKNGALIILSFNSINSNYTIDKIKKVFEPKNTENYENCVWGLGNIHNSIKEMKSAMQESMFAAAYASYICKTYTYYSELGIYKLIMPHCHSQLFTNYSSSIISAIENHDYLNNSGLINTLIDFVKCGGSIHNLSLMTQQHENTIRNRLDKIKQITNLDFKNQSDYEELSIAVKIYICRRITEKYI